jgi:predicted acetyltransferase
VVPTVRPIEPSELPAYVDAMSTGFLERPDVEKVAAELVPLWDLRRTWGAFDGASVVGTFRSWETELTVPGGACLPAAAVAGVTVLPTHRRRGVLRAMVAAEHAAIRQRGEVFGLLYASEYPIYGRFGYGSACRTVTWTLDTRSTGFVRPPEGRVELVTPSADVAASLRDVFEAWRPRSAGEIRRRPWTWEYSLGLRESGWEPRWKGFVALHHGRDGEVDGYARYRPEERWEQRQPRNGLNVDELHALNDDAYLALWQFLASVDWVATVKAERRVPSERLPWLLTNARAAVPSDVGDGMWVRLVDVPRALEARAYEASAAIVVEILDEAATGGRLRLALDANPDGATARPTDRVPDLTLPVAALGAAYLGGTRLRDAVLATGVDEHRGGALDDADRLLRTRDEPWCSTFF